MTLAFYLGRRFLQAFGFAIAAVLALIFLINTIELLRRAGNRDVSLGEIAAKATLQTPEIALTAMPFVVMLASLWCFAQLARSSELVVTRAAGVSVWALVLPAALAALAIGAVTFMLLNPLAAAMSQRFETLEARVLSGQASRLSVSPDGLWLRQGDGERQTVIHARRSNPAATELEQVTLYAFALDDELVERIDAASATLEPGFWLLRTVVQRAIHTASVRMDERRQETLPVPTELTSEQILDSFARPGSIGFWSLPRFIDTLEDSGFAAHRHRLQWHALLATPLLYCAMALIGASFSMRHHRFGGLGLMAFGAVLAGFGFYFLSDVAKALGASGSIPAMLAAWGPPLAAAFSAMGLLLQLEDG
jgi:lipopolysaccharide export system permease protein